MQIDHIHFYVEDAEKWRDWFVRIMGFQAIASGSNNHTHTEVVMSGTRESDRSATVTFVLSSPLSQLSPVAQFLDAHPPGVADVSFAVADLAIAMQQAIAGGATVRQPIQQYNSPQGQLQWGQITGITNLAHTLIQRTGITPLLPQKWIVEKPLASQLGIGFTGIDHVVLNVAAGDLEQTVSWYEAVLGFERKQTFTIQTAQSALYSQVMLHPVSGIQFPVNQPLSANSQIQEFLNLNQGSGIQHIALKTARIVQVTKNLKAAGLSFLKVPQTYYKQLKERFPHLSLLAREWDEIVTHQILVDCEEKCELATRETPDTIPTLLQIFTQPIFAQPTFFFEIIERRYQMKGFGEGNFRALFEAIEIEQSKRGSLTGDRGYL
jgi:4-hydroxyphenylpyruvate dioxygenase